MHVSSDVVNIDHRQSLNNSVLPDDIKITRSMFSISGSEIMKCLCIAHLLYQRFKFGNIVILQRQRGKTNKQRLTKKALLKSGIIHY